ncbi:MAG: O-antigen ligase family protein, partial [Hyphomicrobiales bacterium]|nr:O-antigen ligase family protein [Hyphomicrobiales bacterium]
VFFSFSRAAWGNLLGSSIMVFLLCFALEANARMKVKMLILAMAGGFSLVVALGGMLSVPAVGDMFSQRASVEQNYDSGETGRFGRQGFAFELALNNPWGIGPGEFRNMRVTEEPHDSYVNVLHVYGWGGGLCYYLLIIATLWRGIGMLAQRSPNRLLLIPLVACYISLVVEAGIIDADHWRHYYLIVGLIWGVSTGYRKIGPGQEKPQSALV